MSPLTFTPARKQDAALLVQLYNAAFRADYERYGECPAYGRTVEQMQASIRRFPKLIIRRDGAPVGVLSAQQQDEGTYYIGCLCVIPQAQRQGIGSAALQWFCQQHPDWRVISLITPIDKAETCNSIKRTVLNSPARSWMAACAWRRWKRGEQPWTSGLWKPHVCACAG